MEPLTLAAILAASGLAKSELVDRPRHQRDMKMNAELMRWSPWTKIQPYVASPVADPLGSVVQGGLQGYAFGQQFAGKPVTPDVSQSGALPVSAPPPPAVDYGYAHQYDNYYAPWQSMVASPLR